MSPRMRFLTGLCVGVLLATVGTGEAQKGLEAWRTPLGTGEGQGDIKNWLTPTELHCRHEGLHAMNRAIERDKGWTVTDSLLHTRQWAALQQHSALHIASWDNLTQLVYAYREIPPARLREIAERGCLEAGFTPEELADTTMGQPIVTTTDRY